MFSYEGIVPRADRAAKCRSFALSEAGSCAGREYFTIFLPRQVVRAGDKKFNRLERKNSNRNKFQTLGSSFSGDFSTEQ